MSLLTWTVSVSGSHYADFGRGRYSVARTHGRVPRFVARWHRSRGPFTQGQNITGAPTLEAGKTACERHAEQRTDIPLHGEDLGSHKADYRTGFSVLAKMS